MKILLVMFLLFSFNLIGCVGTAGNTKSSMTGETGLEIKEQNLTKEVSGIVSAETKVTLKILVDENGKADIIEVYKSSGQTSLDEKAIEMLKNHQFKPLIKDGENVKTWVYLPIVFTEEP